jgi:hypothetical protein
MKFLKRSQINSRNVKDNSIAVEADGEIKLETTSAITIPKGTTLEKPIGTNGQIRYNIETNQFEGFQSGVWRTFSFKESGKIVQADLGAGDNIETYFGPLDATMYNPTTVSSENNNYGGQSILVFVQNVFQIFGTDYTVELSPPGTSSPTGPHGGAAYLTGRHYIKFAGPVPKSTIDTIKVTVLYGFDR